MGVTPVPIPNTMVKTQAADGTALVTVWESRWLPNFFRRQAKAFLYRYAGLPVIRDLKRFKFLMTDKTVNMYLENCIQILIRNIKTSEVNVITFNLKN